MVQVTHNKVATTPDDPAFEVGQTEWNDAHAFIMASGRVLGRLSASIGSVEELTFTQVTAQLGIFTGVLSGLVPASGGGTANFLRADGTWAPGGGGTPGGTSGQVQYNNAGAFGGMSGTTWDNVNLSLTMTGFSITKDGVATVSSPTLNPSFNLSKGGVGSQLFWTGTDMGFFVGSVVAYAWNSTSYRFAADASLNWSNTAGNAITSTDIRLFRASAGNLAVGDGTAPQTLTINSTAAPAKLLDVQAVGVTKFSVSPTGAITGLNFTSGAQGLAPASGGGTANFLRADGTWTAPASGGTPGGSTLQLQYNNAGAFGGANVWRTGANQLDLSNGVTAQQLRVYNTTDNNGGTPTNSEYATFDWTTTANVLTIGAVNTGTGSARDLNFVSGGNVRASYAAAINAWTIAGTVQLGAFGSGAIITSAASLSWGSSGYVSPDVFLWRDAAAILAQRNGVNAQTFRVYNTFTDASNYQRVSVGWSSNQIFIHGQAAGTGPDPVMNVVTGAGVIGFSINPGGGVSVLNANTFSTSSAILQTPGINTTLANGLNSNINTNRTWCRIIGPSAAFSVGGFTNNGTNLDGQHFWLVNSTAQQMTIVNEDASSTAVNRITTLTGANVVLRTGTSAAQFIYDGLSSNRWILVGSN